MPGGRGLGLACGLASLQASGQASSLQAFVLRRNEK